MFFQDISRPEFFFHFPGFQGCVGTLSRFYRIFVNLAFHTQEDDVRGGNTVVCA